MSLSAAMRPSVLISFLRSQVSSAIATALDYALVFSLTELFDVWYVFSTGIGAFAGAVAHFVLSRHWSFTALDRRWHGQAFRYFLVSAISLILNCGGVFAVTEFLDVHYAISVIAVSFFVGIFFNFPLHRYYVFN